MARKNKSRNQAASELLNALAKLVAAVAALVAAIGALFR